MILRTVVQIRNALVLTCTLLPLLSDWSHSPDSCPCSPPAPGHSRRSPCKHSHTSHWLTLLTLRGLGTLQKQKQKQMSVD